jgi:hypothetical protein
MRENGARVERERDSSSRAGDREGRLIDGGYKRRLGWKYDVEGNRRLCRARV